MHHANAYFDNYAAAIKCRAMANNLFRTANASRALLLRVEAARHRRQAVNPA